MMGREEAVARRLYFEAIDAMGWPNGQPTWDEMAGTIDQPDTFHSHSYWLCMARAAIDVIDRMGLE